MKRIQYSIEGMSCAACVSHVERAAGRALPQNCTFTVSLLTNSIALIFENDPTEQELELIEQKLALSVRAAGYRLLTSPPKKEKNDSDFQKRLIRLIVSAFFTLGLMYFSMGPMIGLPQPGFLMGAENAIWMAIAQLVLTLPVVVLNFKFFKNGFSALFHLSPNMDSLIAVGSGASLLWGIVSIGLMIGANGNAQTLHSLVHNLYFESAAMILTLVSFGKLLESRAKDKTSDAIQSLAKLSPKYATLLKDGKETTVLSEEIQAGDILLIRSGELIPVDGEVIEGSGSADESALTGESMPVDKEVGDSVSAACVLSSGALTVKATHVGEDTSLSRLIRLLEDAASSKAPIARIADRVSAIFVPCVIAISLLTFLLWMLLTQHFEQAFRSAIAVLVISCPCALGLATPTAITVGIGKGAKNGILFRNAESLEKLCSVKTVLFDKTGTVTEGRPSLSDLYAYGEEAEEVLRLAAAVERLSSHPLALAVQKAAEEASQALPTATDFENTVGKGASAVVEGSLIFVGKPDPELRARIDAAEPIPPQIASISPTGVNLYHTDSFDGVTLCSHFAALEQIGKTAVLVTKDSRPIGVLGISDQIRSDAKDAVKALKTAGVRCLMLTGDNSRTAAYVSKTLNLDGYRASLLPEEKEKAVREYREQSPVAMVGDGINDSPALAVADVGIAVGAGTEIAIDSADVVLSSDSLFGVFDARKLSCATIRIIKQNLFWALFYNAICIPVAAGVFYPLFGWQLSPMLASAAMSFSSVFVVTNALRLRRFKLAKPCSPDESNQKQKGSNICPVAPINNQTENKGDESTMLFRKKSTTETYVINVGGMMCPRCVAHVKNALEAVNGVTSVSVSLESNTATVTASAPLSALTDAIVAAGYEVK